MGVAKSVNRGMKNADFSAVKVAATTIYLFLAITATYCIG
jgi:hypothetical protein